MADTDSGAPLQRIEELEQENEVLRERLEEAEEDIERLHRENEQLRKELKAAGRGAKPGRRKAKADPKRPGRKADKAPLRSGEPQRIQRRVVSRPSKCR